MLTVRGTVEIRSARSAEEGRQPFSDTRVDTSTVRRHMARLPKPRGEVAEWLKAADCKSARASVRWFESSPLHHPASLFELRRIGGKLRAKQDVLRSFSEGGLPLFYVYLIESVAAEGQRYVGATADLKVRLQQHNAGQS